VVACAHDPSCLRRSNGRSRDAIDRGLWMRNVSSALVVEPEPVCRDDERRDDSGPGFRECIRRREEGWHRTPWWEMPTRTAEPRRERLRGRRRLCGSAILGDTRQAQGERMRHGVGAGSVLHPRVQDEPGLPRPRARRIHWGMQWRSMPPVQEIGSVATEPRSGQRRAPLRDVLAIFLVEPGEAKRHLHFVDADDLNGSESSAGWPAARNSRRALRRRHRLLSLPIDPGARDRVGPHRLVGGRKAELTLPKASA